MIITQLEYICAFFIIPLFAIIFLICWAFEINKNNQLKYVIEKLTALQQEGIEAEQDYNKQQVK